MESTTIGKQAVETVRSISEFFLSHPADLQWDKEQQLAAHVSSTAVDHKWYYA